VTRRVSSYVAALAIGAGLLAAPGAWASSGGAGFDVRASGPNLLSTAWAIKTSSEPQIGATVDVVQPGDSTVTASGGGVTLASPVSGVLANRIQFTGTVAPSAAGATIEIERLGAQTGWTWAPTASGTAGPDGSFAVAWRANHIGRFAIRAVVQSPSPAVAGIAAASPSLTVIVYRPSIATQYGPGFYGNETACGEVLRPRTLGLANRTLPCGTRVAIYFHGATMVVSVIDRGPYANHADWDLTVATAHALGIAGTATIGAVSLPSRRGATDPSAARPASG
jgi:hypothetical protein